MSLNADAMVDYLLLFVVYCCEDVGRCTCVVNIAVKLVCMILTTAFPSFTLVLIVVLLYLLSMRQSNMPTLYAAWVIHAVVLALGWTATPFHFGFAPALSMVIWALVGVYITEKHWYPQLQAGWMLGTAALGVALAWWQPGPVILLLENKGLSMQFLHNTHWLLGILAHGLLLTAVVHGVWTHCLQLQLHTTTQRHPSLVNKNGGASASASPTLPLLTLERLTFKFTQAGWILLTIALALGCVNALVTNKWHWNHKTVLSFCGWATLTVLLWGRWQWGWRGKIALRLLYTGVGVLFLGYVGSHFVLEMILHKSST